MEDAKRHMKSYFNLQLRVLASGYPHEEHSFFCLWKEILPHLRQAVCVLVCLLPKEVVPFVCSMIQMISKLNHI
jgi:hypothetical protein